LHARYVIEADDGALIYVENNGIRFGALADIERLKRGEPVPPGSRRFRRGSSMAQSPSSSRVRRSR
jgi:hypothetical protein